MALCTQFTQGTPDADLGAIIFDVTGLPDTTKVKEVARIRTPDMPGRLSQPLSVQALRRSRAAVHDDDRRPRQRLRHGEAAAGRQGPGTDRHGPGAAGERARRVLPRLTASIKMIGYHDFYVGYDPATRQDKFYGAGRRRLLRLRRDAIGRRSPS